MKLKLTALLMSIVALCLGFQSCNSDNDDDPNPGTNIYTRIVSYVEGTANGSTFTYRERGDSPLITLYSTQALKAETFKVGTRIIIQYTSESTGQNQDRRITLLAAANVEGQGKAVESATAESTNNWNSDGVAVQALYRSGDFVDVQFTGYLGDQQAKVAMYVDETTLDSEQPQLHLIFGPYSGFVNTPYIFYGSWNIANIWNRPNVKSVKVNFNGTGAIGSSVILTKDSDIRPS